MALKNIVILFYTRVTPGESPLRLPVLRHPPRPLTGRRRGGDHRLRKVGLEQKIIKLSFLGLIFFQVGAKVSKK